MLRIESLLSARLFIMPQLVDGRLYFMSNLSGQLSLYAMRPGGSVPEPLLPPHIAMQNPHLMTGHSYHVFPRLGRILVMLDRDGDEKYQPMLVPIEGGFPEPAFGDALAACRVHCQSCEADRDLAYFHAESSQEQMHTAFRGDLAAGTLEEMGRSKWGAYVAGVNKDHTRAILLDAYTAGDHVLHLWTHGGETKLLYGKPMEERAPGETVPLNSIGACFFTPGDQGLLFTTSLFSDAYGLGYLGLASPDRPQAVTITGAAHAGAGELTGLDHLRDDRYRVDYNIDGCSWMYEGTFDEAARTMRLETAICGQGEISNGVLESAYYDEASDAHALSFSTAVSPTQIYTVGGRGRREVVRHTCERVLGIPNAWLSPGEDASFVSHDGTRMSARLYLPAVELGFEGRRPVVCYVHGGPQSQERPDFAWFSMPLIQFLTLSGFAVFVPNVRGSSGYGLSYMKQVDHDWGGKDCLDHVHALTQVLSRDDRLDVKRAGVVGRSYGGYMSLTLAARHPDLWSAAVDMFGPYDLLTFMDRLPETWKPYFALAVGDPVRDHDFLVERSPRTHIGNITCPLLVIQGRNDPRVIERESHDVVERLRANGKAVDYLVFENEGHDVLKYENRVRCYGAITEFFQKHLMP